MVRSSRNKGTTHGRDASHSVVQMLGGGPGSPTCPPKQPTAVFVGEPYTLALSGLEIAATGIGSFATGEIGKMPSTELAWYALLSQEDL
jgi:hypothetical protein